MIRSVGGGEAFVELVDEPTLHDDDGDHADDGEDDRHQRQNGGDEAGAQGQAAQPSS